MFAKQICLVIFLHWAMIDAYSVSGPKNQPEKKALKFRSPPTTRSDAPNRPLPNKASWLPASLTTPKSKQMMNPLQNRSTSPYQNRAVESRLFFSPQLNRSGNAAPKTSQVGGRLNLSLFSSLSGKVDKINKSNFNRSLAKKVQSVVSQRRTNARLNTLLKLANVFEETVCTEERMAAIRAEFDLSNDKVSKKKEFVVSQVSKEKGMEPDTTLETKENRKIRIPLLGRLFRRQKASDIVKKSPPSSVSAKETVVVPFPTATENYLSSLKTQISVVGSGLRSHVDTLNVPAANSVLRGSGFCGYLDSLSVNSSPSITKNR
jgi:hypothetical protein